MTLRIIISYNAANLIGVIGYTENDLRDRIR